MSGRSAGGRSPSITWRSVRQVPQARTRTRTSPGPASGSAVSRSARGEEEIGAGRSRTIAFMPQGYTRGPDAALWGTRVHARVEPGRGTIVGLGAPSNPKGLDNALRMNVNWAW